MGNHPNDSPDDTEADLPQWSACTPPDTRLARAASPGSPVEGVRDDVIATADSDPAVDIENSTKPTTLPPDPDPNDSPDFPGGVFVG
jgi:hypothetical protein